MRTLFMLLLAANVALFVYARWLRAPDAGAELIPKLEVNPERMRVIGTGERARTGAAMPRPQACVEWGPFAGADVARADAAMAALSLPGVAVQRATVDTDGYWVFLPAAKTKTELDRRLATLRAHGVRDYYVVQEQGPQRNAVSLGIFRSEEAARAMAEKLAAVGIPGVLFERREHLVKQIAYRVREPDPAIVARLAELQREFPGSEVKAVACPDGAPAAG